jgi:UDP-N-acetylmuramyl pentapeptide phosphotransferase/UDP-N-acetylglucosamine-1-phosphate transferase
MAVNLAACVTAFLICFISLPVVIKFFLERNLVDNPGGRKIHKKITPSLGGIAIFLGFLTACLIWVDYEFWDKARYILAGLFLVFILGIRDDLVPFRALHKLFGQIVAVTIVLFSGVKIASFYGLFGFENIPPWLAYLFTAFVIILVTNSFNLIDGLDGLAGSIGLSALTSLGLWFYLADQPTSALLCFAMAGGILAFLIFNWEPSEIFMGDTGAMVIGMLLAILVIEFMTVNASLQEGHIIKYSASIATSACFIIIPLSDTLRIIILRSLRGQSPFSPDKSHIHHAIMRLGASHSRTSLILACVNLAFISLAWLMRAHNDHIVLPIVIGLALLLSFILDRLIINKMSRNKSLS